MDKRDIEHTQGLVDNSIEVDELGMVRSRLSKAEALLELAMRFMNNVPNQRYGDNYAICARISEFLKKNK